MNTQHNCDHLGPLSPSDNKQVVGMLYVPVSGWKAVYAIAHGFSRGTIFPELDKPFIGRWPT